MIVLSSGSDMPLYMQIYDQLRNIIINSGRVPPGTRVPSTRHLAQLLNVSRNTVEFAYQQLYADGYLESRPRQGFFAAELEKLVLANQRNLMTKRLARLQYSVGSEEKCRFDFRPGKVEEADFPFSLWNKLFHSCLQDFGEESLYYGDSQGELGLRVQIAKYLAQYRGVLCGPEQVVLCSGTQSAISVVCQLLRGEVKSVAVEEPGYYGARNVFANHGLRILPVAVEEDGLAIDSLIKSKAGAVYVTPCRHYPLGVVTSAAKRKQLLEWAAEKNTYIIEDDYNGNFRYGARPIQALQGISNSDKVIYIGGFSQSLLPSIRVAYLVLPNKLLRNYKIICNSYHATVPFIYQKCLELFMDLGHFERHLRKINLGYKAKHNMAVNAVKEMMPYAAIFGENPGVHILLKLKSGFPEDRFIATAADNGIKLNAIAQNWARPPGGENVFVAIGFAGVKPNDIVPGISLLSQAWAGLIVD